MMAVEREVETVLDQHPLLTIRGTKRYLMLAWVDNGLAVLHSDNTDPDSFEPVKRDD
jgi:hypothetical protein